MERSRVFWASSRFGCLILHRVFKQVSSSLSGSWNSYSALLGPSIISSIFSSSFELSKKLQLCQYFFGSTEHLNRETLKAVLTINASFSSCSDLRAGLSTRSVSLISSTILETPHRSPHSSLSPQSGNPASVLRHWIVEILETLKFGIGKFSSPLSRWGKLCRPLLRPLWSSTGRPKISS